MKIPKLGQISQAKTPDLSVNVKTPTWSFCMFPKIKIITRCKRIQHEELCNFKEILNDRYLLSSDCMLISYSLAAELCVKSPHTGYSQVLHWMELSESGRKALELAHKNLRNGKNSREYDKVPEGKRWLS